MVRRENIKQFGASRKYSRREGPSLDYYLQEIGKTPLLTREEEAVLARRVRQGDKAALDKLVRANLRFVVAVAKRYQNQGMDLPDLISEGNVGLTKAAKRFDETRGFKFISYAVWWIRQAILQALAEQSRIVRIPMNRTAILHQISKVTAGLEQKIGRKPSPEDIAAELGISPDEVRDTLQVTSTYLSLDAPLTLSDDGSDSLINVLEDKTAPSPDEELLRSSLRLETKKVLRTLKPREAEIVSLYFGLNGNNQGRGMTLEEIGLRLKLTRERVRQIKTQAIQRLRLPKRARRLQPYASRK